MLRTLDFCQEPNTGFRNPFSTWKGRDVLRHENLLPAEAITAELTAQKSSRGRSKIYKEISDEHRAELVSADVRRKAQALERHNSRVDLSDLDKVKERTQAYLAACAESGTIPNVLGLASYGLGCSRQWLNEFVRTHPHSPTAEYIETAKDAFADILINASLNRAADATMGIFVLKNCAGFRDRFEIEPVTPDDPLGAEPDQAALEARIEGLVVDD